MLSVIILISASGFCECLDPFETAWGDAYRIKNVRETPSVEILRLRKRGNGDAASLARGHEFGDVRRFRRLQMWSKIDPKLTHPRVHCIEVSHHCRSIQDQRRCLQIRERHNSSPCCSVAGTTHVTVHCGQGQIVPCNRRYLQIVAESQFCEIDLPQMRLSTGKMI